MPPRQQDQSEKKKKKKKLNNYEDLKCKCEGCFEGRE